MSTGTEYADDALVMDSNTTMRELKSFVRKRTQNPFVIDGKIIWNYSSYKADTDALEKAAKGNLDEDMYMIPFQVTGVWGYMTHIIPDNVARSSSVLVYLKDDNEYVEYNNLLSQMESEEIREFKDGLTDDLQGFSIPGT